MRKLHTIIDFVKISTIGKIERTRKVCTSLEGNAFFVKPDIDLITLTNLSDSLETHHLASLNGDKREKAITKQIEEELVKNLRLEARYVDRIADGDEVMLLSSGFTISKPYGAKERLLFRAKKGPNSGSALLRRKNVKDAHAYIFQVCKMDVLTSDAIWSTIEVLLKGSLLVENLSQKEIYWFRVAYVTSAGTSDYCDPIMYIAV